MTRVWNTGAPALSLHVRKQRSLWAKVAKGWEVRITGQTVLDQCEVARACLLPDWPIKGRQIGRLPRYARLRVAREQELYDSRH